MAKILLVDDDPAIRETHGEFLRRSGHSVATVMNGAEALRAAQHEHFDVMITDLIMPEKEGLETILEMQRIEPQMKIIAMSGGSRMSASDYLKIAKRFGAAQTLAKPFSGQELNAALADVLTKPKSG